MNWLRASLSNDSAAARPLSPVALILAAISPATIGVEKDVPLHLAIPAKSWVVLVLGGTT